ncbi:MAG TPA: hypothetical protein ENI08_00535, partial [Candidatus Dependentiae bacterium]|nr:hypothetical protein [Candidatus Dependentiae bacterium]
VNLKGANLQNANFSGARIQNSNLEGAMDGDVLMADDTIINSGAELTKVTLPSGKQYSSPAGKIKEK